MIDFLALERRLHYMNLAKRLQTSPRFRRLGNGNTVAHTLMVRVYDAWAKRMGQWSAA